MSGSDIVSVGGQKMTKRMAIKKGLIANDGSVKLPDSQARRRERIAANEAEWRRRQGLPPIETPTEVPAGDPAVLESIAESIAEHGAEAFDTGALPVGAVVDTVPGERPVEVIVEETAEVVTPTEPHAPPAVPVDPATGLAFQFGRVPASPPPFQIKEEFGKAVVKDIEKAGG